MTTTQERSMSIKDLKGTYVLDPAHTSIAFIARHAMVTKVRGTFSDFEGQATIDGANPADSTLSVTVNVASVNTGQADRDAHLTSPDFFDVAQYPTITFQANGFDVADEDSVNVTGDLTIRGVTQQVTIPFEFTGEAKDPFGNIRVGFEGKTEVKRKDFGLTWNAVLETGGVLVSDKVVLEFDVSAIKQA